MTKARLEIRQAESGDIASISALARRVYDDFVPYTRSEIRGQLNNYPEGCFVAILDGKLVGYCATMRIRGETALRPHSWDEITGNGYGSRHDPTGAWIPRCAERAWAVVFTRNGASWPSGST